MAAISEFRHMPKFPFTRK